MPLLAIRVSRASAPEAAPQGDHVLDVSERSLEIGTQLLSVDRRTLPFFRRRGEALEELRGLVEEGHDDRLVGRELAMDERADTDEQRARVPVGVERCRDPRVPQ